MKLACIVLAHRGPDQLQLLLRALRHPDIRVYLHLDRRVPLAPFTAALAATGVAQTAMLERRPTRWGGAEVIDAVLEGLARGLADGCDYFLLISGQDFPLRPAEEIVSFAREAGDRSFVEGWPLPTERWRFGGRDRIDFYTYNLLGRRETCIPRGEETGFLNWRGRLLNDLLRIRAATQPRRRFPDYARPFGGWSWLNLSRSAVEYILEFVAAHPDYRAYHRYTLSADEVFFQSILLGTAFADRHEVVNDSLRFTIWPEGSAHPRTLTEDDLPAMRAGDDLFARKFDSTVDESVLMRLSELVSK